MDKKHGEGSSKHLTNAEVTSNESDHHHHPLTQSGDSVSVSPSSSSTSSQELIVLEKDALNASLNRAKEVQLVSKEPISSSSSSSQPSGNHSPIAQSPQNYLTGHPGYDPTRIPASIFGTKPTTATEWSVTSNESLFSIHMGNGSFSRDHVLMSYKSEESAKLDEVTIAPLPSSLPPLNEAENNTTNDKMSVSFTNLHHNPVTEAEPTKKALEEPAELEKLPPGEDVRPSVSVSLHSDGSTNSTRSFAFPVFPGDAGSSVKVDLDKQPPPQQHSHDQQPLPQQHSHDQQPPPPPQPSRIEPNEQPPSQTTPEAAATASSWFPCFSCCLFSIPFLKVR